MSPVIILGLVLMWAVVLVPMWMRRHDDVEESRSVDRFTAAMHTLSRYNDRRDAVKSHQSRSLDVHVSGASAPDAVAARRRRTLAQRRARSLAVLGLTDLVVLVVAITSRSALAWSLQIVLDVACVSLVVHLRRMATLAAAARRRAARQRRDNLRLEAALAEPEAGSAVRPEPQWEEGVTVYRSAVSEPVYARAASAAPAPASPGVFDQTALTDDDVLAPAYAAAAPSDGFFDQEADEAATVDVVPAEAGIVEAGSAEAEPGFMAAGPRRASRVVFETAPEEVAPAAAAAESVGMGEPWEPVPVPRPTYAMKPAAPPRPTRRPRSEPILPPVETPAELDTDDDLEAILDRRWAVND